MLAGTAVRGPGVGVPLRVAEAGLLPVVVLCARPGTRLGPRSLELRVGGTGLRQTVAAPALLVPVPQLPAALLLAALPVVTVLAVAVPVLLLGVALLLGVRLGGVAVLVVAAGLVAVAAEGFLLVLVAAVVLGEGERAGAALLLAGRLLLLGLGLLDAPLAGRAVRGVAVAALLGGAGRGLRGSAAGERGRPSSGRP
ncbi:hypothetical protein GA0115236_137764 [Streptomyces sp. IgraMP-1]|nr:hypothetical protein GA0115236_137764 [Streptomyces sp. IgraMP-1]